MKPMPRQVMLGVVAGLIVSVWAFPVLWALLTSFKTERDVLAYPPVFVFTPTLANYREVLFGPASILPNLWSSLVVTCSATARQSACGVMLAVTKLSQKNSVSMPGIANMPCASTSLRACSGLL